MLKLISAIFGLIKENKVRTAGMAGSGSAMVLLVFTLHADIKKDMKANMAGVTVASYKYTDKEIGHLKELDKKDEKYFNKGLDELKEMMKEQIRIFYNHKHK